MDCNKDEAKRAMEIAERKITEKDYTGAKKLVNKAQNLDPELDGLKQLLIAINVYISGEKKFFGEPDWYGVLNVTPSTDDEAVKKQYRKLILMFHPDKNKSKVAEGAFKLVAEAWRVLSDKFQRFSYNNRRDQKEAPQRFPTTQSGTSNGFQNVREPVVQSPTRGRGRGRGRGRARPTPKPAARMDRSCMGSSTVASSMPGKSATFWTKCNQCNTQYEYMRMYLNQSLLCPNCQTAFKAEEKTPPENVPKPSNLSSNQQHRSSKNQASNKNSSRREPTPSVSHNFQRGPSSRMAGINIRDATTQAENVGQQAPDRLKRGFGESQESAAAREFTNFDLRNFKRSRTDDSHMRGLSAGKSSSQAGGSRFSTPNPPANGNTETPNTTGSRDPHIPGMLLPCDITKGLKEKAQADIFKRLPKMMADVEAKEKSTEGEKKSMKATSKMSSTTSEKDDEVKTIVVPDSDFHNFDVDRSEFSFKDDEIWAAYDDDDGMPRFYARIQKVISLNPFKMKIGWLNSKSTSEFGPIEWMESGFAKTCGDFRSGRYETTDSLNSFSHKVNFTKGARGLLHILPKKGQVWALYRNWSPEWDKDTPDEVVHKYEMVEVLDDYTEDNQSVTVTLLLKAEGFRAVFRRSTDENDVRKIAKEEMFRFSHQVPRYILTGKEADNVPEGCLELDPAATPCESFSEHAEVKEKSEAVKERSGALEERSEAVEEKNEVVEERSEAVEEKTEAFPEADNVPEGCPELEPAAIPCESFSEHAEAKEKSEAVKERSEALEERSEAVEEKTEAVPEADNVPEGCLELDPAATPCESFSEHAEAKEKSEAVEEMSEAVEEKSEAVKERSEAVKEKTEAVIERSEAVEEISEIAKEEVGMMELDKEEVGMMELEKEEVGMMELEKEEVGTMELDKEEVGTMELDKEEVGMTELD